MYPIVYLDMAKRLKQETNQPLAEELSKAAAELGRRGGLIGGKARAIKLSAERRKEIARKAAEARWKKIDY